MGAGILGCGQFLGGESPTGVGADYNRQHVPKAHAQKQAAMSGIPANVHKLQLKVDDLLDQINELNNRLSPVMRVEEERPGVFISGGCDGGTSPVSSNLGRLGNSLNFASSNICEILRRLDI